MRVMQVHNRYRQAGGEDTIVATEAELLPEMGCEVLTYEVANPEGAVSTASRLALAPANRIAVSRVSEAASRFSPAIVHVHNTWFSLSPRVVPALAQAGYPVVMTLHNYRLHCVNAQFFRDGRVCTDCLGRSPWRGVLHSCYRGSRAQSVIAASTIALNRRLRSWECVDQFLPSSPFIERLFAEQGVAPNRLAVHPNVLPDPGERSARPSESDTLLFVGRLSPEKGLGLALDAWEAIASDLPGLRIEVIGDGPERARLNARRHSRVEFAGFVPPTEVIARMRSSRALLFPSQWFESFPRTIVEACASGLPVLAAAIGAHGETAARLGPGWTVTPADSVSAWSTALTRLADDEFIDRGGVAARSTFVDDHSPKVGARRLMQIYQRSIDRHSTQID